MIGAIRTEKAQVKNYKISITLIITKLFIFPASAYFLAGELKTNNFSYIRPIN